MPLGFSELGFIFLNLVSQLWVYYIFSEFIIML